VHLCLPCRDDFRSRDGPDDRGRRYGREPYGRGGGYGGHRDGSRERDYGGRDYDGGGGYGRESPEFDSRRSPAPDEPPGKPLSKTMFIKRHIDDDLDEAEIDRRCAV
jgi:hypothetical protein